ncbi:FecR family protein [Albibacterium bauzanense]|uniref:FecR family protein n=1 Tax=Albibacterium bauzanense TaxID=653929 RepID=A0A4R1LTY3_9SPHI|nr:FecR family protein [Albibacterium bauzanense]TCK80593.1 FecR family protein [Albibacterium bauzanense]
MKGKPYYIAQLISKYLQGIISEEEEVILEKWLGEKDENRQLLDSFKGYSAQSDIDFISKVNVDEAWERISHQKKQDRLKMMIRYTGYAAAAVLIVFSSISLLRLSTSSIQKVTPDAITELKDDVLPGSNKAQLVLSDGSSVGLEGHQGAFSEQDGTLIMGSDGQINYSNSGLASGGLIYNTLIVPKAGTYSLILSDGTKVWVNAMSELKFPVNFDNDERIVYLKGEAYFEVAHDTGRPFIVNVNGTQVEVLGTRFNINSYDAVTTTLMEGSVKIASQTDQRLLKPGQEAIVRKDITIQRADTLKAVAWKSGDFYFKNDNILQIAEQLSRWYDISINFEGQIPKDKMFSGSISRNVNLSEVVEMLTYISGSTYDISGRNITIQFK